MPCRRIRFPPDRGDSGGLRDTGDDPVRIRFPDGPLVSGQLSENRGWLVAAWAGTCGLISALAAFIVLAATDAGDRFPTGNPVISITFGVVIISPALATSIAWLARAVHLPKDDDVATGTPGPLALARAALNRLEEIEQESERRDAPLPASVLGPLRARAQQRLERASASSKHAAAARHPTGARELAAEMMRSEQEELLRLRDSERPARRDRPADAA